MYLVFNDVAIDTSTDQFTILGCCSIGLARIIRQSGVEEHIHFKVNGEDRNIMNIWDPCSLSVEERRDYVIKLYHKNMRNSQIAALLNVSQATVCVDLKNTLFKESRNRMEIIPPNLPC